MIYNHRLQEAVWAPSPNCGRAGGLKKPKYIVIHYTAGRSAESSVRWLSSKAAKASAHLVVGRDGSLYQLVGFDTPAWHAGQSEWRGTKGLNNSSIGIELDGPGWVVKTADGRWRSLHLGTTYEDKDVVVDDKGRGWVTYTDAQLRLVEQIGLELREAYPSLVDVIGHSDCAPGRKLDPGFAYPMDATRAVLFGRAG